MSRKRPATTMPPKRAGTAKKYGMAPVVDEGEILTDFHKIQWILGKSIASGGFGRIYLTKPLDSKKNGNYVIKMEPAENGPLFQEYHMYQRICKPDMLEKYKKLKGLRFFGVPALFGAGLFDYKGLNHRFLILPRLGPDLEKIRDRNAHGKLSSKDDDSDVFKLFRTCLNVYEYLHAHNCVHADLKAENLLLADFQVSAESSKRIDISESYLVDFGLAKKLPDVPVYKEQPKKCHDGTLIFTSLDAHRGCAPSYRGDLEILAYNVILWLSGSLPWMAYQSAPEKVRDVKIHFSKNVRHELTSIFGARWVHLKDLTEVFDDAYSMDYALKPDYVKFSRIVENMLKNAVTSRKSEASPSSRSASSNRNGIQASPLKAVSVVSKETKTTVKKQTVTSVINGAAVSIKPRSSNLRTTTKKASKKMELSNDEDSGDDLMFVSVPKRTALRRGRPIDCIPSNQHSTDDDEFSTPKAAAACRSTRHMDYDSSASETPEYQTPLARVPIRPLSNASIAKPSAPSAKGKNPRRLSTMEAALVKKYCKPKKGVPAKKIVPKVVRDEGLNTFVTETGTQTSPTMTKKWLERKARNLHHDE